tara:strand:- start:13486 stop:14094 length:609 start_codon:yes stop_codon:yes gene_type:complete
MNKSVFNIDFQQNSITSKIVVGLERISEVFRTLLWEHAKKLGLSPIQIQILIFIDQHKIELCNVSYLAKEFNVSKPTISDAVKALEKKNFIIKDFSASDSRSYSIRPSTDGKKIVYVTSNFANPLKEKLETNDLSTLETVYETLNKLIFSLNKSGVISVQRTCYACKFYERRDGSNFCNYLNTPLYKKDIRLDCPEFSEVNT